MGIDFGGQVWKRVWKMTVFGLKWGQDLENRATHPCKEFSGVPPWGLHKPEMSHNRSKICPKAFKLVVSGSSLLQELR